jgi:hypothetical protein
LKLKQQQIDHHLSNRPTLWTQIKIENKDSTIASETEMEAGLSYRASGGLLAGEPGGRAGGPVHYALYESGGVL